MVLEEQHDACAPNTLLLGIRQKNAAAYAYAEPLAHAPIAYRWQAISGFAYLKFLVISKGTPERAGSCNAPCTAICR